MRIGVCLPIIYHLVLFKYFKRALLHIITVRNVHAEP